MIPKLKYNNPNRLHAIDEIRGFCLVLMVVYHLVYDILLVYNINWTFFFSENMNLFRDMFAGTFIFIAGISRNLSRNNLKNAFKIIIAAIIISIVTNIWGSPINFGILHFMGVSILISQFFLPFIKKIPKHVFYPATIFLILILKNIYVGYIGIKGLFIYNLPMFLYSHLWLSPLGFPSADYISYDYFPMIPWFFVFMLGMYFGRNFKNTAPAWAKKSYVPFLSYIGAHSLLVYLLHQPIVLGLVNLSYFILNKL